MNYLDEMRRNRSGAPEQAAVPVIHPAKRLTSRKKRKTLAKATRVRSTAAEKTTMAKLRGKKKEEFLKRMGKGRAKAKRGTTKTTRKAPRASKEPKKAKKKTKSAKRAEPSPPVKRKKGKKKGGKSGSRRSKTKVYKRVPTTTNLRVTVASAGGGSKRKKSKSTKGKLKSKSKTKSKGKKGKRKSKCHPQSGGGFGRKGAMENPMTGVELFVGGFTGLLGFGTADVVDRLLATHALVAPVSPATQYTDTPPTTGSYANLFNPTSICAPMNALRWSVGLGVAAVPIILAHFITAPVGRSALQFFGFGAGIRVVGKGLVDLVALLTNTSATGMRLYEGEQTAQALAANPSTITTYQSQITNGVGTGRPRLAQPRALGTPYPKRIAQAGCGQCGTCKSGVGCCTAAAAPAATPAASTNTTTPAAATNTTTNTATTGTTGLPTGAAAPRRNPYLWGENKKAA